MDIWGRRGERFAQEMKVLFLGSIPIEAGIRVNCDSGTPFVLETNESKAAKSSMR